MIQITADTRRAVVTNKELLTVGSAGIQVEFTLSEDWDGLSKLAVFRVGDEGTKVDVVLGESLTCVVPPEVLTEEGEVLFIGIYGANGSGSIIIPTVWASAGVVKPGTEPNTPATAEPTPEIWAQILGVAEDAEQTATEAMSIVGAGLQELSDLEGAVETAEAQRVLNEQGRVDAESQRALAENARVANENTWSNNETSRMTAESSRVAAENGRVSAETARVSAEASRVTAEEGRVAAEEYREEKYAEYVEAAGGYAEAAGASATAAAGSATSAASSASAASTSATQAASSASSAGTSASQASSSASSAGMSATTASNAATTATTKAGEAAASATSAAAAKTAAEAAQAAAEDAAESIEDSAAQIAQNTQDIADLEDEKQDKPATAGTAGQVLGLDSNLDPAWVDQTGGVTSVNGKTGAVTLGASDVGAGTYSKPSGGIPASDLASAVQTSLGKADSAYQKPVGGIPATDLASAVQTSLGKADTALQTAPVSSVAGKTGAVTLGAGDIEFDDSEAYPAGSLGAAVSDAKNAISQKQNAPSTAGTAGQVLGLDSNLDPVWVNQSGGGDVSNCAPVIINTASGDIATFVDGADNRQIKKIVGTIVPQQDLHGYESPWPAGGGKNKLKTGGLVQGAPSSTLFSNSTPRTFTVGTFVTNLTANNYYQPDQVTQVSVAENAISVTTNATAYALALPITGLTVGAVYAVSAVKTNGIIVVSFYKEDGTFISKTVDNPTNFTVPAETYYTLIHFDPETNDTQATFTDIQLELGSSATSFAPYSNECPISGHTGLTVTRTGENVFNQSQLLQATDWAFDSTTGYYYGTRTRFNEAFNNGFPILPKFRANQQYTITLTGYNSSATSATYIRFYYTDGSYTSISISGTTPQTFTGTSTSGKTVAYIAGTYGSEGTALTYIKDFMLVEGSTASTYEPYTGTTIPITWQTEAGTVYVGTLDVVSGKMYVTSAKYVFDGTQTDMLTNWRSNADSVGWLYPKSITPGINAPLSDSQIPNLIADKLKTVPYAGSDGIYYATIDCISIVATQSPTYGIAMRLTDTSLTTVSAINAFLAQNPVTVVYELAQPVEYTITANELTTLYGQNNVWTDVGEIQSCAYSADTKLYIDNKIATAVANALNA